MVLSHCSGYHSAYRVRGCDCVLHLHVFCGSQALPTHWPHGAEETQKEAKVNTLIYDISLRLPVLFSSCVHIYTVMPGKCLVLTLYLFSLSHSLTHLLPCSLTHSFTHSLPSLTHSLTHSPHSLTPLTHTLTVRH